MKTKEVNQTWLQSPISVMFSSLSPDKRTDSSKLCIISETGPY